MMNSEIKTLVPSLITDIHADLFTLDNISDSATLEIPKLSTTIAYDGTISDVTEILSKWDVVVKTLPLDYIKLIENYPDIYTTEKFDKKYIHNPKRCSYDRYGLTNMWRPLMALNRCPSITKFNFEYIRYYNITVFSQLMSVLIARNL